MARTQQRWAFTLILAVLAAGCGSCSQPNVTSAAPPWKVCGHTVYSAPAGPVIIDTTRWPDTRAVTHISVGNALYLRLPRNCSDGAQLRMLPRSAASISKYVKGKHGLVAVIVKPRLHHFDIRIVRGDGTRQLLHIRLE